MYHATYKFNNNDVPNLNCVTFHGFFPYLPISLVLLNTDLECLLYRHRSVFYTCIFHKIQTFRMIRKKHVLDTKKPLLQYYLFYHMQ